MDPSGVFATTYRKDRALIRTRKQAFSLVLFLLLLVVAPLLVGPRVIGALSFMYITAVAVVGLQICMGYAGQVNLGQTAFMGVGAYTAAVLVARADIPFLLTIPLAGLTAALFGLIFGLTAVRIKGFYLALTTLAAQFLFHFAVLNLPASWLGGSNGMSVEPASFLGFTFTSDLSLYYLCLGACALLTYGAFGIVRSRFGRAFVAVRDDDVAAGLMGINVQWTKILAFSVSSFYAGVAGALWAYTLRFIAADHFTLFNSIFFIAMIIVGGMGSIVGALIGVVVIRTVQETITSYGPSLADTLAFVGGDIAYALMNVFLGAAIAAFIILEPKGLMHRWNIMKSSYRLWPYPY